MPIFNLAHHKIQMSALILRQTADVGAIQKNRQPPLGVTSAGLLEALRLRPSHSAIRPNRPPTVVQWGGWQDKKFFLSRAA